MKVICPICRKVFNKHENLLIHLHNNHNHLSSDKMISIVCKAKQYGFRRGKSKTPSEKEQRNILNNMINLYKYVQNINESKSVFWGSIIKTPCK